MFPTSVGVEPATSWSPVGRCIQLSHRGRPNSQIFLLNKCEKLLYLQKLLTFFSKNISVYVIFDDQSFNDTLTNDIVSFEQLGPDVLPHAPYQLNHKYKLLLIKVKNSAYDVPHDRYEGITKTPLYNFDPIKPHFYIVKLGFTGVYIIFHISAQSIDYGYSLEPPRRGGSNEYPQSMN